MRPVKEVQGLIVLDVAHEDNRSLVMAMRALQAGEASAEQQRIVFDGLLNDICRVRDLSFRPGSERLTAFYEGRRHVGLEIAKMITSKVTDRRSEDG